MLRIIGNKKGQAAAGTMGDKDRIAELEKKLKNLNNNPDHFDEKKINRGQMKAALAGTIANTVGNVIGRRLEGKDKTVSLSHFLGLVLMPVVWFLRILQNNVARLLQIAIIFMIAGSMWIFVVPAYNVLAAEEDLRGPIDFAKYVVNDVVKLPEIMDKMGKLQQRIEWSLVGQYVEPEKNEEGDDKKYGIYMGHGDVGPLKELYGPNEKIIIYAYPQAEVLTGNYVAEIGCQLEGSMSPPTIYPSNAIALRDLPGTSITCVFDPVFVSDDPQREATVTIKYSFSATSTLPVSVMSKTKYDTKFNETMKSSNLDFVSTKKELAKSLKVDYNQIAESEEITPVVIGAKITEYQPIIKSAGYTASLLVTVINQGEGTIQEITSMKIDAGDLGLKLTGIGIDIHGLIVDPQYLHSIGEINNFQSFLFGVETWAFQLDSKKEVTTTRIKIEVDYIYNISATTDVNVASCRTFPEACGETVEDVEENE